MEEEGWTEEKDMQESYAAKFSSGMAELREANGNMFSEN